MLGRVGLDLQGVVHLLIRPQARNAHHPVLGFAYVGQPLPSDVRRVLAPLAVPVLVYYQDPVLLRGALRIFEQELQAAFVDRFVVPTGFRKEPLQALCFLTLRSRNRLGVRKRGERLVALGG